ncbi:MAG: hypothetical protein CL693_18150 [Cellvibrionaceae bacterium]|nr:hypothetical protein [Cellvibrionaceae bacterium]
MILRRLGAFFFGVKESRIMQAVQHYLPGDHVVEDTCESALHMSKPSADVERLGRVLVIGSGPVGMRFVDELLRRHADARIEVFSNEPYAPYNRVQLSTLLAGESSLDSLKLPFPCPKKNPNFRFTTASISNINTTEKVITDVRGNTHNYDHLVIATGARAHVPNIEGVDRQGVYTFRNMKDTQALYSRLVSARHLVVVGGGVLGLEAAKGLTRLNTRVTLIQQSGRLMNRQLDDTAADLLLEKVKALGIEVITNSGVREVLGNGRVSGIRIRSGEIIECDTVLLCAGIRPNIDMAREARLKVGVGILVDDQLRTSAEHVFAIGECCEHGGLTYGLVSPGFEQAAVAADALCQGSASYRGSTTVSRLKVVGEDVVSLGEVTDLAQRPMQREIQYHSARRSVYRKLVVYKGRLQGVVGFGGWDDFQRLQEAYQSGRRIWPWQWVLFWLCGRLWLLGGQSDVKQWPASAVVCQCNQVTQGELVQAVAAGTNTVSSLRVATRAGTVCGSCKPLLSQLTDSKIEKASGWQTLLISCGLAFAMLLTWLSIPGASVTDSVQVTHWFEKIWNDKFWKQVTGFTLAGLVALGMIMSLRKRMNWRWLGPFFAWRLLHAMIGVTSAGLLMFHTGFHTGENLNQMLMMCFLLVLGMGALAGLVTSLGHKLSPNRSASVQRFWNYLHILVAWPLPVLLITHIVTVYYF